jgi:hypothetical protein
MAPFRPRIGIEQIELHNRCGGQPTEKIDRIARIKPDIVMAAGFDQSQDFCHAIDKGLAADETLARMGSGLRNQIFAAAEADFEPDRIDRRRKQLREIRRRRLLESERKPRQQRLHQRSVVRPQRVALTAAEEGAVTKTGGVVTRHLTIKPRSCRQAGVDRTAGQVSQVAARRSASTRSVRSQEKPPSGSGARPKWPYALVRA